MEITSNKLIEDLIQRTKSVLNEAQQFSGVGEQQLNWKPSSERWSILECIEHLNRYGDFYIPELNRCITKAEKNNTSKLFKSGLLGNYFAKSLLPKERLNKMKTFKSMNPIGSDLDKSVLTKFIHQQKQLLDLLDQSRAIDLQKVKTAISISKWIKLRIGDTFRVVIYHNQRHLVQANKNLERLR